MIISIILIMMMMELTLSIMTSLCIQFFENSIFKCQFGFELRILTPYRVESTGKTSIFGLDTTINR